MEKGEEPNPPVKILFGMAIRTVESVVEGVAAKPDGRAFICSFLQVVLCVDYLPTP